VFDYLNQSSSVSDCVNVSGDANFIYVIPHVIDKNKAVKLKFRIRRPLKNVKVRVLSGDEVLMTLPKTQILPAEMEMIQIPLSLLQKVKSELRLEIIV
jgi:hypothetical protein